MTRTSLHVAESSEKRKHPRGNARPGGRHSQTALGYARVSTDEQAREGVSLDAQQSRIRAYCEAKELELVDMLTDDGISGKTLDRPALRKHSLALRLRAGDGKVIDALRQLVPAPGPSVSAA